MRILFSTTEMCLVLNTSALELGTCSKLPFNRVSTLVTALNSVYLNNEHGQKVEMMVTLGGWQEYALP